MVPNSGFEPLARVACVPLPPYPVRVIRDSAGLGETLMALRVVCVNYEIGKSKAKALTWFVLRSCRGFVWLSRMFRA